MRWRHLQLPRPGVNPPTVLAALLVACWIAVAATGGPPAWEATYAALGLSWDGVSSGRVWQLLTHALLHAGTPHLVGNVLLIYLLGGRVAVFLGGRAFLGIFAFGSLVGALVHLLLPPLWVPEPVLVGASGGGMALLVAFATLSPDSRMWPLPVRASNLGLGVMLAALLLALLQAALGWGWLPARWHALGDAPGISELLRVGHGYHFGGGLAGWLAARRVLRRPPDLAALRRSRRG
jgi:membrane associated rhomboid family serine protease